MKHAEVIVILFMLLFGCYIGPDDDRNHVYFEYPSSSGQSRGKLEVICPALCERDQPNLGR